MNPSRDSFAEQATVGAGAIVQAYGQLRLNRSATAQAAVE